MNPTRVIAEALVHKLRNALVPSRVTLTLRTDEDGRGLNTEHARVLHGIDVALEVCSLLDYLLSGREHAAGEFCTCLCPREVHTREGGGCSREGCPAFDSAMNLEWAKAITRPESESAEALRKALTVWCCKRPVELSYQYSDREGVCCLQCLPDHIVSWVFDHEYDRGALDIHIVPLVQNPVLRLPPPPADIRERVERVLSAVRAHLDVAWPEWRSKSLPLGDDEAKEHVRRCAAEALV